MTFIEQSDFSLHNLSDDELLKYVDRSNPEVSELARRLVEVNNFLKDIPLPVDESPLENNYIVGNPMLSPLPVATAVSLMRDNEPGALLTDSDIKIKCSACGGNRSVFYCPNCTDLSGCCDGD